MKSREHNMFQLPWTVPKSSLFRYFTIKLWHPSTTPPSASSKCSCIHRNEFHVIISILNRYQISCISATARSQWPEPRGCIFEVFCSDTVCFPILWLWRWQLSDNFRTNFSQRCPTVNQKYILPSNIKMLQTIKLNILNFKC